ncbi:flavin reductase [Glutamicibacter protophormiae]|uniref:flavin reductase n=1 Tax=Glutamicibacter protophormiae TaxID=37930 RepID=UPI0019573C13|nr:flavin reductase [Glutamicibacter protophormiae]QRQ79330.1 flavin reductase [Glutamicibacter protophormiae]
MLITTDAGQGPVALTKSSVTSVSAQLPLQLLSVSRFSSSSAVLFIGQCFIVHFLYMWDVEETQLSAISGIGCFSQAQI